MLLIEKEIAEFIGTCIHEFVDDPEGNDFASCKYCNARQYHVVTYKYLSNITHAMEVAKEVMRRYNVEMEIIADFKSIFVLFQAGDSNCHHQKPYDPSDGHGYTFGEHEEKLEDGKFDETLCRCICYATMMVKKNVESYDRKV